MNEKTNPSGDPERKTLAAEAKLWISQVVIAAHRHSPAQTKVAVKALEAFIDRLANFEVATPPASGQAAGVDVASHIEALGESAKREARHLFDLAEGAEDMAHLSMAIDRLTKFAWILTTQQATPPASPSLADMVPKADGEADAQIASGEANIRRLNLLESCANWLESRSRCITLSIKADPVEGGGYENLMRTYAEELRAIRAHLAAPAPVAVADMVLVPREPTEAMWTAGRDPVMHRDLGHKPALFPGGVGECPAWQINPTTGKPELDKSKGTTAVHVWRAMVLAHTGPAASLVSEDTKRLDFAEQHLVGIECIGSPGWMVFGTDCGDGQTLRAAIDAAIAASTGLEAGGRLDGSSHD